MGTQVEDQRCRTCAESSAKCCPLLDQVDTEMEVTLAEALFDVARIDIKEKCAAVVPTQMCWACAQKLRAAYGFARQARAVNDQWLAKLAVGSAANKQSSPTGKDCLLETPIDMQECLQIKVETEFCGENSLLEFLDGRTDVVVELGSLERQLTVGEDACEQSALQKSMKEEDTMSDGFEDDAATNQAGPDTSSSATKYDPIAVAESYWSGQQAELLVSCTDESTQLTQLSESCAEVPPKRRRGRPRLAKTQSENTEGRFSCEVCGKTFAWKKDLQRHANSHFAAPEYECKYCERQFLRKDKLKDHMKIHSKRTTNSSSSSSSSYSLRSPRHPAWNFADRLYTSTPFRRIECKLCGSAQTTTTLLRQHMQLHEDPATLRLEWNSDLVKELFPNAPDMAAALAAITEDLRQQRFAKYYAIVNEYGYEMSLSDSDADSDGSAAGKYKCELCGESYARKHAMMAHTKERHAQDKLPYKCTVCKLGFVAEGMHQLHVRTQCRSKEKKYQCLKCPGKFMWVENLEGHKCSNRFNTAEYKAQLPLKRDVLQCNVCAKTFVWVKDLKRHMETHDLDSDSRECVICYQRFFKEENLRMHLRKAHEQFQRRIQCCLCGAKFAQLAQLRAHLQQHANGRTGVNATDAPFFKVHYPQGCAGHEADAVAQRIAADFRIKNMSQFYSALDESGNELDLYDSETDEELQETVPADSSSVAQYTCELCAQTFPRRKRILLHQYSEHADALEAVAQRLPYTCTECQKAFVCRGLLEHHLNNECLNLHKKYQCERCLARFVWQDNLARHTQLKHTDPERQISRQLANKLHCDQCNKVFIWAKDLTRHKRVHLPENEKYECPYCERRFNRKDNMHSHLKVHGADAYEAVCKKELSRSKQPKVKGMDENLCKPNGCKQIQCMVCLSKHTKIADLRTHLRAHQQAVSLAQRLQVASLEEISAQLYADEPAMTEEALSARISADVTDRRLNHLYSITNEVGYELSLDSSETDSDSDTELGGAAKRGAVPKYRCELCTQSFGRKYQLFEHQMWAHDWEDAPHVCAHCNARFVCAPMLQLHYAQQCRNAEKRFVCRKCPRRFMWRENLKVHLRTRHAEADDTKKKPPDEARTFDCLECKRSFQMQKDLTRHMIMHRSDASVFKCLWCPRRFYRMENLHMHIKRHGMLPEQLDAAVCIISATSNPHGAKRVCCKVCNRQFTTIADLRAHLLHETASGLSSHHTVNSPLNYSITNEQGFELHLDDSETDGEAGCGVAQRQHLYSCELCKLACKRKYEMTQHQRSIHKQELLPFKCERCIFKTVSKDILDHHMRTQCYNTDKQLQCDKCPYKFMWQENLDAHRRLHHPLQATPTDAKGDATPTAQSAVDGQAAQDGKLFSCEMCQRKYNRKDRLTAHIKKVHVKGTTAAKAAADDDSQIDPVTGEELKKVPPAKKFLCAFCGRAVTSSSNLIIHMRRHTGEKPFKCDFCEMAFPRSSDLQCHRRTHTGEKPHQCTVCNKAFSRSYKLQTHMRIHSGERPYKCTYCEKSFTQSNDLTLHIRRHTGERPYVCGVCGERFIQGTALKYHRIMHGHFEQQPA